MALLHAEGSDVLGSALPDPIKSLRVLRVLASVYVPALLGAAFLLSGYAVILIVWAVITGAIGFWAHRKVVRSEIDEAELFVMRPLNLTVPRIHPKDAKSEAFDRSHPNKRIGKWWRQPGPCSRDVQIEELVREPGGREKRLSYWRRVLLPEERARCVSFAKYLRDQHREIYEHVTAWWEEFHANQVANQIRPGSRYADLSPEDKKTVRERTEVEFFWGMHVALSPESWASRVDRRPSHRSISALRSRLSRAILPPKRPTAAVIDGAPWKERPRRNWIHIGDGFEWEDEHTSMLYYRQVIGRKPRSRRAKRAARKLEKEGKFAKGDWGILGVDYQKIQPLWTHYDDDLPQHTVLAGASGFGKTIEALSFLLGGIYNNSAVVWMDPKVDGNACDLVAHHAKLAGREDQLVFLSVSRSDIPSNCSFNPLAFIPDPARIGDVLAGMLPEDAGQNQYFVEEAKNIGRTVGSCVFWLNRILGVLSGGDDLCWHPPRLILWVEYCRLHGIHTLAEGVSAGDKKKEIAEALIAFDRIYEALLRDDRTFIAKNDVEKQLFILWCTPEFCAKHWRLHFGHLNEYALNQRQRLVSWVLRILFPYAIIDDERFSDPLFPRSDTLELVTGWTQGMVTKGDSQKKPSLIELYERSGVHLLQRDALVGANKQRLLWSYLYEQIVDASDLTRMQSQLVQFDRIWKDLVGQARRAPDEYGQAVANLRAPVSEIIAGAKYDLLCDADPHITWDRIHREKLIVILALGSMSDQKASDAISKAFTQTLLAYGGYLQDHGGGDMDLVFVGDEMFSWVNSFWASIIDKLRGCGVRTVGLCQSEPGMRHAVGSADLFKHILASTKNRYTCATKLTEDAEAFINGLRKVPVYMPQRTVSETPSLGESGNKNIADWSMTESWAWQKEMVPVLSVDWFPSLPVGVFFHTVQDKVFAFKAALFDRAPESFMAEIGMNQSRNHSLIEGIDYGVDSKDDLDRLKSWGGDDRLHKASGTVATVHLDDVDQDVPEMPKAYGSVQMPAFPEDGDTSEGPEQGLAQEVPQEASGSLMRHREMRDDEGNLHCGLVDDQDHRVGWWSVTRESGSDLMAGAYEGGVRIGAWNVFDHFGTPCRIDHYSDGELVGSDVLAGFTDESVANEGNNGSEGEEIDDDHGADATLSEIIEDGMRHVGKIAQGTRVGMWVVYRDDGTKYEVQYYDYTGRVTGLWERYDEYDLLCETYQPVV